MTKSRGILAPRRPWDEAEIEALRTTYADAPTSIIARVLERPLQHVYAMAKRLRLEKSAEYMASPAACRLRRGDATGAAYRFTKGHVPANKGLRRPGWSAGRMATTQFRKGQRPHTWMPIGSRRLIDGYEYTKLTDVGGRWSNDWRPTHVLLWEKTNGPIPPKHALCFRNRDRTDIRIDNLELISRRELMARNTVHNLPKELAQVVQLKGALQRQINKRSKP